MAAITEADWRRAADAVERLAPKPDQQGKDDVGILLDLMEKLHVARFSEAN